MSEKEVLDRIDLLVNSRNNMRIFHNVVGKFKAVSMAGQTYYVPTGLCVGSGDRIGWQTVKITPDMVGRHIAQFVSIEGKAHKESNIREGQIEWRDVVRAFGGAAMITWTPEDVGPQLYAQSKGVADPPDMRALAPKLLLLSGGKKSTVKRRKTK